MKRLKIILLSLFFGFILLTAANAVAQESETSQGLHLSADIYASHSSLMQYHGQQNDLLGTFHLGHSDFFIKPFLRASYTGYDFGGDTRIADYSRKAAGGGLDAFVLPFLRLRLITESVTSSDTGRTYQQDSYGLIYNQYLDWDFIELSNYLESFYIPRVSSDKIDTFLRVQALKSFYLQSSAEQSHSLFPFVQYKAKYNDEANFGLSGHVVSAGGGYKFFSRRGRHNTAFIIEGHSVLSQSRNFDGDWFQVFGAFQYFYE